MAEISKFPELILQGLAVILNAFTVIIIIASRRLRKTQNIFICNVALADGLSAMFVMVAYGLFYGYERSKGILWIILTFRSIYFIGSFSAMAIAVHRLIIIRFDPFNKRNLVTAPRCIGVCVIMWALPFAVLFGLDKAISLGLIIKKALPALIFSSNILSVVCYSLVYWAIVSAARNAGLSDRMLVQRMKQNKKVLTTFALVVGTNVLCWTPYCLSDFISAARPDLTFANNDYTPWYKIFYYFALSFQALNGVLNPVIYWTRLTEFRQLLKGLCPCSKREDGGGSKSGNKSTGSNEMIVESSFQTPPNSGEIPQNSNVGLSGNPSSYPVAI